MPDRVQKRTYDIEFNSKEAARAATELEVVAGKVEARVTSLHQELRTAQTEANSLSKSMRELSAAGEKNTATYRGLETSLEKNRKTQERVKNELAEVSQIYVDINKRIDAFKSVSEESTKANKQQSTSIKAIRENLRENIRLYESLTEEQRENSANGRALRKNILEQREELTKLNQELQNTDDWFTTLRKTLRGATRDVASLFSEIQTISNGLFDGAPKIVGWILNILLLRKAFGTARVAAVFLGAALQKVGEASFNAGKSTFDLFKAFSNLTPAQAKARGEATAYVQSLIQGNRAAQKRVNLTAQEAKRIGELITQRRLQNEEYLKYVELQRRRQAVGLDLTKQELEQIDLIKREIVRLDLLAEAEAEAAKQRALRTTARDRTGRERAKAQARQRRAAGQSTKAEQANTKATQDNTKAKNANTTSEKASTSSTAKDSAATDKNTQSKATNTKAEQNNTKAKLLNAAQTAKSAAAQAVYTAKTTVATKATNTLTKALLRNPFTALAVVISLVIAQLVALIKPFTQTREGAEALRLAMGPVNGALREFQRLAVELGRYAFPTLLSWLQLLGGVLQLNILPTLIAVNNLLTFTFNIITRLVTLDFSKIGDDIRQFTNGVALGYRTIFNGLENIGRGFVGIFRNGSKLSQEMSNQTLEIEQNLRQATVSGQELARWQNVYNAALLESIVALEQLNFQSSTQLRQARDLNKTEDERNAALDEALRIETSAFRTRSRLLNQEARILKESLESRGLSVDYSKEYQELQARIIREEATYNATLARIASLRQGIADQGDKGFVPSPEAVSSFAGFLADIERQVADSQDALDLFALDDEEAFQANQQKALDAIKERIQEAGDLTQEQERIILEAFNTLQLNQSNLYYQEKAKRDEEEGERIQQLIADQEADINKQLADSEIEKERIVAKGIEGRREIEDKAFEQKLANDKANYLAELEGLGISEEAKLALLEKFAQLQENQRFVYNAEAARADGDAEIAEEERIQEGKIQALDKYRKASAALFGEESKITQAITLIKELQAIRLEALNRKRLALEAARVSAEVGLAQAEGQAKSASSVPFPANLATIAGYIATFAPILKQLFSATSKAKSFKHGGHILDGPSHERGGIPYIRMDGKKGIELEGNELVIKKEAVGDALPILSAINEKHGGASLFKHASFLRDGGSIRPAQLAAGSAFDYTRFAKALRTEFDNNPLFIAVEDVNYVNNNLTVLQQNTEL